MNERKKEVLPIAIRLFSEKGYNATSVEEIAKESGMAKGSFYKLFHSKEDLLIEIIGVIPYKFKKTLTQIYSRKYDDPKEILIEFITGCLKTIQSSHINFLITLHYEMPHFKSKDVVREVEKIELEMNQMNKEFFLFLYGDEIKEYIWDIMLMLKGYLMQYSILLRNQHVTIDINQLAVMIGTIVDIAATGLMKEKPKSVFPGEWPSDACMGGNSPLMKGQKTQYLFRRMEYILKEIALEASVKEEYQEALSLLEEEWQQRAAKSYLVKALIHFLQAVPEMKEDLQELQDLWN